MSEPVKPNLGLDLRRIHAVITRALAVTSEHSASYARAGYPNAALREGFLCYARTWASVLHAHHLTEDRVAFPSFRAKLPDMPIDELMAEHQQMAGALVEIDRALDEAAAHEAAGEALEKLHRAIGRIAGLWPSHIGKEEAHLSPDAAGARFDMQETIRLQQQFVQHTQQHAGPDELTTPFLLYNLPPEERAIMASAMPPIVIDHLVPVVWKERWQVMKPFLLD